MTGNKKEIVYSSDELLEKIISIAKEAGKIILNADRTKIGVSDKEGSANFVTTYDVMVQKFLEKELLELLPEAEFLGEESTDNDAEKKDGSSDVLSAKNSDKFLFIVDPIDGTTNFIKDYHMSCVSIGLIKNDERYIGVVYNPYLDEVYSAVKGNGAYLNDKRIHVSFENLENGIVLFGSSPYNTELARKSFDMVYEYFNKALDVRRSGSAALDLCAVAAGRAELFFELLLSPWDFAAGALIVTEAGGVVTTVDGEELSITSKCSVLAKNK